MRLRVDGERPDAVVASSANCTDAELEFAAGEWVIDLANFAGTAGPWTVRARRGARWLEWGDVRGDGLAPWLQDAGWALVTLDGAAAARLVIATSPVTGQLAIASARVRSRRSGFEVEATALLGPHGPASLTIVLTDAASGARIAIPAAASPVGTAVTSGGWRAIRVRAHFPWSALAAGGNWAAAAVAIFGHGTVERRVAMPPNWRPPRARGVDTPGSHHVFEPRASFKQRALTVRVESLGADTWEALRARPSRAADGRPLWLIGELPDRARDNGLALFRHLVARHPEIDARYVITSDSPDRQAVEAIGPALIHGTPEHARAVLAADRIASSHHPDYLFPLRTPWMRRRVKATRVFLQHGVLAAKWVADIYGAGSRSFETDLFLVSSPRERATVMRDFRFAANRVAVTGLPRFDTLFADEPPKDLVLVVPTWRPWISGADDLAGSDFAATWRALLTDPRTRAAWGGLEVVVLAHPNMAALATAGIDGARAAAAGEPIQELVRRAAMLVTDYSSIAIDAALLRRPVVYFEFDRDRLQGRTGGHSGELPGDVVLTVNAAIEAIERAAAADFSISAERAALAATFFPALDANSSERVFEAIRGAVRTRPGRVRGVAGAGWRRLKARVARSSARVFAVRSVYEAARLLPMRRDAVLFECSFGRQFGDSPKAIYEELRVARPNLTSTWVGVTAPAARSVGRMSPRYAVALARSGALVANQSFPHWMRTRRSQLYVQTWHGTPLKRMLHDLDHITGRDAGYVSRATRGAAQWSVLLSPNPHTTRAMETAFRHNARVLEIGYPRNDVFRAPDAAVRAAAARAAVGVPEGKAMVLHAPTFRDEGLDGRGVYVPTEAIDMERFAELFGDSAVLVLRRHVLDRTPARIPPSAAHCVIDGSSIDDVQDLLVAADVLVTDYSSLAFDFLNTRRPCIFLAPDLDSYRDRVRGFYLDEATDLPGPIVRTGVDFERVLGEALATGAIAGYDTEAFAARYCPHDDGHAAARVVAELFGQG